MRVRDNHGGNDDGDNYTLAVPMAILMSYMCALSISKNKEFLD